MRKKDDETDDKTGYKDKGKGKKKRARNKIRPNFGLDKTKMCAVFP